MNRTPLIRSVSYVRVAACTAIAFFGLVSISSAQVPAHPDKRADTTTPAIKRSDRGFLEKAAKAGMEEVEISRVAAQRTTNENVRKLAQMIISDHEAANADLTSLAASRGVALPAKDTKPEDQWQKHNANSFDKDYVDKMVSAHEDAVKLFDREARNGDDAETMAFARKQLPAMQHHLQEALDLKRTLK